MASVFEEMPEVVSYVKNQGLGFSIPYVLEGNQKNYLPDFIAKIDDLCDSTNLLNLVVEVSGERKKEKAAKVSTATNLWIPAVNNHGGFGRWEFIEISDPWEAKDLIRKTLKLSEKTDLAVK